MNAKEVCDVVDKTLSELIDFSLQKMERTTGDGTRIVAYKMGKSLRVDIHPLTEVEPGKVQR